VTYNQDFNKGDSKEPSKKLFKTTALAPGANCAATISNKNVAPPSPNCVRKDHNASDPMLLRWMCSNQAWLNAELKTATPANTRSAAINQGPLGMCSLAGDSEEEFIAQILSKALGCHEKRMKPGIHSL
jgi:hypothetical protein